MENNSKFDSIAHLFGSYYYQSVWDFYNTDEEIWNEYLKNNSVEVVNKLISEIYQFMLLDENTFMNKLDIYTNMGGTSFDDIISAKTFFADLQKYLIQNKK